ncbi:MAG TPA: PASTA domain-containing protein, partial [Corynebacterium sp.]|uniref:PASTA domain-containing protein n=1 Tax=Corynebacterium sp. TaxID=1720 RepID=UPI0017DCE91A
APGYGDDAYAGRGGNYDDRGGAYDDRGADYDDRDRRNRRDDGDDGRKGGFGKGATIIAVTAIIAIVILVALMFRFLSGDDESADPTGTTPPPEPSSTTSETLSPEESTPTSDPMRDELDRLRDEVNSLRETPPAIPGLGGGEVVEATVPEAVGKSPAEVELALRRAGFGDITILDANGNTTNSLSALTGTVATIDPPAGTATTTDQAITITLE